MSPPGGRRGLLVHGLIMIGLTARGGSASRDTVTDDV
ncbi:hypothetical protein FHU36_004821 [Nonomuraea muscovyensis]|uniref:Uncharacterized protein n=1 Tax=Nonomuraea muscovyensis TaxID=1124761 RepID=A0A7X0F127_9ACTN|nr:hypothetical protein [Nonomuraea muscovyensis]